MNISAALFRLKTLMAEMILYRGLTKIRPTIESNIPFRKELTSPLLVSTTCKGGKAFERLRLLALLTLLHHSGIHELKLPAVILEPLSTASVV